MFHLFKNLKILITIIIIIFFLAFLLSRGYIYKKEELQYGVTFSQKQAIDLGLNWQETYLAIFQDLGVKKIRLSAYWDEIEKTKDEYFTNDLDWQIKIASENNAKIILAVGNRLPRWPECHTPEWVNKLNKQEKEKKLLEYIEFVITKYKNNLNITNWQIENEPFLPHFGKCPEPDANLLNKEITLAKKLDNRKIIITDSGELSLWIPAAKRANIFGTTMYRDTYSEKLKRYIHYPIEPGFFRFKKNITRLFANPSKWLVIELQAEPWGPKPFQYLSKAERDKTMNLKKFKEIIEFSSKTGFKEFYLWGVEWWYWEKTIQQDDSLWKEAKKLY